jgi:hypothetical protein
MSFAQSHPENGMVSINDRGYVFNEQKWCDQRSLETE